MNRTMKITCGLLLMMGISQSLALAKDEFAKRPFHIDLKGGYTAVLTGEDDSIDNGFGYGFNFGYHLDDLWKPLSLQLSYFILQTVVRSGGDDFFGVINSFSIGPRFAWPIPMETVGRFQFFVEGGLGVAVSSIGVNGSIFHDGDFLIQAGTGIQYLYKDFLAIGPAFDMHFTIVNTEDSDALIGPMLIVSAYF